eukprot:CAMPEP_0203668848 /NCGR_PEP_ID=MMETSP0090-20130426/5381_1 /ASSEMBLY_ACC=CAM_ASM_001088 /TAXON_ID=426623 /ORGANISM="Chaetoceros affinis, Strain CCMP159" /LENGTH=510 /DNA_ID=CAMNT_0050533401 /DNA_START=77 /DNA_END=1609 /DNA_ORIENTATION=+
MANIESKITSIPKIVSEVTALTTASIKKPLGNGADPGNMTVGASTASLTESNVTESNASSSASYLEPSCDLIRAVVAQKLQSPMDSAKLRTINAKGRSIKFPVRLMYLLEECQEEFSSIFGWAPDGLSFIIYDSKQFEERVLPTIFKDAKFNSFLRKLYRWGFMKRSMGDKRISYINHQFQRGNYSLCMDMSCSSQSVDSSGRLRHEIEAARAAVAAAQQYSHNAKITNQQKKKQKKDQQIEMPMSNESVQSTARATEIRSNADIGMQSQMQSHLQRQLQMQLDAQNMHIAFLQKQQQEQQRQLNAYLDHYIANEKAQNSYAYVNNNDPNSMGTPYTDRNSTSPFISDDSSIFHQNFGPQQQQYTYSSNNIFQPINDETNTYMYKTSRCISPSKELQEQHYQQEYEQHYQYEDNEMEPPRSNHCMSPIYMDDISGPINQRSTTMTPMNENYFKPIYQEDQYSQHVQTQAPTSAYSESVNEMHWNTNMTTMNTNDSVAAPFGGIHRRGGNY